jgi:hypothetical protein
MKDKDTYKKDKGDSEEAKVFAEKYLDRGNLTEEER